MNLSKYFRLAENGVAVFQPDLWREDTGAEIYVWSDIHLSHERISEMTGRPWDDVNEMNAALIANHNSVVKPEDLVIWVGDICMGIIADSLPLIGQLNGHKMDILGNHDRPHPTNKKASEFWPKYAEYFEWMGLNLWVRMADQDVQFCHFPFKGTEDHEGAERYKKLDDYYPEDNGQILAHGHTHSPQAISGPRSYHLGVDADWTAYDVPRYHPISLTTLIEVIKSNN